MIQRTLVRSVSRRIALGTVFHRQEILADDTCRLMVSGIDNIAIGIPTIFIKIFLVLIQRFACVNEIFKLVFAGNFCTARLDYCPLQTFRITGLNISLFQICRRLTPAPTITGTVTGTGYRSKRSP